MENKKENKEKKAFEEDRLKQYNEFKDKKDLLEKEFEKLKDIADVDATSDIPVTEKKTKEKQKWME